MSAIKAILSVVITFLAPPILLYSDTFHSHLKKAYTDSRVTIPQQVGFTEGEKLQLLNAVTPLSPSELNFFMNGTI